MFVADPWYLPVIIFIIPYLTRHKHHKQILSVLVWHQQVLVGSSGRTMTS